MTENPLSPHLHIYKWQIPMLLSILHRGTGVFLSIGALLLAYWLLAAAGGPDTYAKFSVHANAWYGRLLLAVFVFSLYYHLCNGIRHLFWDMGLGLEIKTAYLSAYAVILATLVLTAFTLASGLGII